MRRVRQRDAGIVEAERLVDFVVGDMVHHPHRHFGNANGEFLIFDAIELAHVDPRQQGRVNLLVAILGAQRFQFQPPDFAVGDHQKVAAAAGRIKKGQPGQLFLKAGQILFPARAAAHDLGQFRLQIVQKQRADDFQDIGFGGVMGALGPAFLGIHDRLEQRTENGGRNLGPIVPRRIQQQGQHLAIELGQPQPVTKQPAVDIGEGVQFCRSACQPLLFRCVQHVEQFAQNGARIAAIGLHVVFNQLKENVLGLENPGIVGKQAEQQPHQQLFQIVPGIARCFQRIVQLAHQFRRLDGNAGLGFKADLAALDKGEGFDMAVQVGQLEFKLALFFQIDQPPVLEIAGQHIARALGRVDAVDIVQRLLLCRDQAFAKGLHLDDDLPRPEEIDIAALLARDIGHAPFIAPDLAR